MSPGTRIVLRTGRANKIFCHDILLIGKIYKCCWNASSLLDSGDKPGKRPCQKTKVVAAPLPPNSFSLALGEPMSEPWPIRLPGNSLRMVWRRCFAWLESEGVSLLFSRAAFHRFRHGGRPYGSDLLLSYFRAHGQ